MKKFIRPISRLIRNIFRSIRGLVSKKSRFVRITPWPKGKIFFWDKLNAQLLSLISRGEGDSSVLDTIFTKNAYNLRGMVRSKDIFERYETILRNGMTPLVVDCGANIGAATKYFALEFPEALIVGIELESENSKLACKNNPEKNISIINAAIGCETGYVGIANENECNKDSFRVGLEKGSNRVLMMSMQEVIKKFDNAVPFIVKIDIEGFEKELFAKNTEWMYDIELITLEIHDWMLPKESSSSSFLKEHAMLKRDMHLRGDMVFSFKN